MHLPVFRDPVTREPSVSLTLLVIAFTVTMVRWCLGGLAVRGHTFGVVTPAEVEAWLGTPSFLYFGRTATKAVEKVQAMKIQGGGP